MPDEKYTDQPAAAPLTGAEIIVVDQGSPLVTVQTTTQAIADLAAPGGGGGGSNPQAVADLQKDVGDLQTDLTATKSEVSKHTQRLSTAEADITALESTDSSTALTIGTMQTDVSQHGTKITALENSVTSATTTVGAMDGRVTAVEGVSKTNADDILRMKTAHQGLTPLALTTAGQEPTRDELLTALTSLLNQGSPEPLWAMDNIYIVHDQANDKYYMVTYFANGATSAADKATPVLMFVEIKQAS